MAQNAWKSLDFRFWSPGYAAREDIQPLESLWFSRSPLFAVRERAEGQWWPIYLEADSAQQQNGLDWLRT